MQRSGSLSPAGSRRKLRAGRGAGDKLGYLAVILLAGAAGLLAGLLWAPIGIAAASGLIAYFVLAVAAHIRADDVENLPTPAAIELLAVAALVLRLVTL